MKKIISLLIFAFLFQACSEHVSTTPKKTKKSLYQSSQSIRATDLQTANGQYRLEKSKYRDYSLYLPAKGWDTKQHYKTGYTKATIQLETKPNNAFLEVFQVTPTGRGAKLNPKTKEMEPTPINLAVFAKQHMEGVAQKIPNFALLEASETTLGTQKAKKYVYTGERKNEKGGYQGPIKMLLYIATYDHEAYLVHCTEALAEFDESLPVFEDMATSLRFGE